LIDQSVVPFASSYVIVYAVLFAMLVGNHAMPMMLRFALWCCSKVAWTSDARQTLGFLLDHPRR
jgi:Trk-type K+ transport system membrane component